MNVVDFSEFSDVRVLAGSVRVTCSPLPVFSDEVCLFLNDMSRALMASSYAKRFPDVVSFAYWCRKGNVSKEREIRAVLLGANMGRGLAFHIAPGNVPVNFAFTYVFSLLAGNASVVRCPSRAFDQVEIILDVMCAVFDKYPEIAKRTAFVTYPPDGDTTRRLCALADARVIWGGDRTVANVRALPSKPRCIDVSFADRYSFAVIGAREVTQLDGEGLKKLARGFYNDTYLMDQNACSTPQTVFWIGSASDRATAQSRFWDAVCEEAHARYELQPAVAVDKHVQLFGDVIRGVCDAFEERDGFLTHVHVANLESVSADLRGTGGFFYEREIDSLADIADLIDEKWQTLSYFGVDQLLLRSKVMELGLLGIDRIVPIGNALDIGIVWDGFDLIETLSRSIAID